MIAMSLLIIAIVGILLVAVIIVMMKGRDSK